MCAAGSYLQVDGWRARRLPAAKGHEIRYVAEYEGELNIDERIVADMITASRVIDVGSVDVFVDLGFADAGERTLRVPATI